jgi:hypothetical protein
MRAKFKVYSTTKHAYGHTDVLLQAVCSNSPEDNQFAKATPSGELKMTVSNPAVQDFLVAGNDYYLDFTPVPKA